SDIGPTPNSLPRLGILRDHVRCTYRRLEVKVAADQTFDESLYDLAVCLGGQAAPPLSASRTRSATRPCQDSGATPQPYMPSMARARRAIEIARRVSGSSSCNPVSAWIRSTR